MENNKKIEVVKMKAIDIKTKFGNPRKISKAKYNDLKRSLETYGDFGIFLIDENDNVIGGNQRLSILKEINPDVEVTCKKLIGYTEAELRAINIRDNTHNGEWDLDLLADWTADLNLDLNLDLNNKPLNDRKIKQMELINHEKYNYVIIVCRNELDYNDLTRKLQIDNAVCKITEKKNIKARAIWYDDILKNGDNELLCKK